jgi:hypothetical protein
LGHLVFGVLPREATRSPNHNVADDNQGFNKEGKCSVDPES